jgi:Archaeal PaREP1/PaREP8 family.
MRRFKEGAAEAAKWHSAHEVGERLKSFAAVVDVLSLSKPWVDLEKYRRDRLKEALYEAELAEEFLKNGVVRNAAGKAFQAAKAYLAAVAAAQRDKVAAAFPGRRRLSPTKVVERGEWIIAVMPTSRMREVAAIVGDRELRLIVELALNLHEFQYNGLDRDAEVYRYANEEMVKRDIEEVVAYIKRAASSQQS